VREQLVGGLGARDLEILRTTSNLRLVTGGQLHRLAFSGPTASSTNSRIARRTLARLTSLNLLQRLDRRVGGIRAGSGSFVYALTPKGAEAIGQHAGRGRLREPSLTFVRHQLAIAEVVVQLHEARDRGLFDELQLAYEPACWRPLHDGTGSTLKPDLLVVIGRQNDELVMFIEVDNGTEHAGALARKLGLYRDHYASGHEQRTEGVFPEVLWLVPDEPRAAQVETAIARFAGPQLHRVLLGSAFLAHLANENNELEGG
jgi:hypothetical protein